MLRLSTSSGTLLRNGIPLNNMETENKYEIKSSLTPIFRIGLMGEPGTGKTTSALTFPGVRLLTKDNKQPPGTTIVPFYDPVFENSFADKDISRSGPRSGLINFLVKESTKRNGPMFTEVMDSWTAWMNDFEIWSEKLCRCSQVFHSKGSKDKGPEVDKFKVHAERLNMCIEIMAATRALKCNLIINIHEAKDRNEEGIVTGVRPLSKGQFQDQFAGHVTCFFRQKRLFDKASSTEAFVWQIKADSEFFPILPPGFDCSRITPIQGKYMKADYATLMQAMGTPITQ